MGMLELKAVWPSSVALLSCEWEGMLGGMYSDFAAGGGRGRRKRDTGI